MRVVRILLALGVVVTPSTAWTVSKPQQLRGDVARFFGPDNYPPEAIRRREQSRVVALLMIDTAGRVVSCKVTGSSGSSSLDKVTCDIALANVTFEPATDRRGWPIASSYTLPVRWVLPSGPQEVPVEMMKISATLTLSIDEFGKVVSCRAQAVPADAAGPDPCDGFPADYQTEFLVKREGRPKGATIVRRMSQEITPDP